MNVEIGTEAPIFLFWEYLFRNFGILSLQCGLRKLPNYDCLDLYECQLIKMEGGEDVGYDL